MRRYWTVALAVTLLGAAPRMVAAQSEDLRAVLQVTRGPGGLPLGWGGGPAGTLFLDSTEVHSPGYSGRIERRADSPNEFSTLTLRVPAQWRGDTLTYSAWLRTKDVTGWATLWLREDGSAGPLAFASEQGKNPVRGTTEWTRYTLRLPLNARTREVYLGALVSGPGTAWLDDAELLVDGRPAWEAPRRETFAAEADHAFDAGSGVATQALSRVQVENLTTLGKVWGFAKYHHPRVARGEVNWDAELFRVLPAVLQAPDRAAADAALSTWLGKLGDPAPCTACARPDTGAALLPDLAWTHDRGALGPELVARLEAMYRNRPADEKQYYVSFQPGAGNPDFSNERAYPGRAVPDAGYRLLALYRFWNIVQYWYPNRAIIGEDWTGVLSEFVPRLMAADDSLGYRLALMALIARVQDTHANLWGSLDARPPRGPAALPVWLRFVDGRAVVAGYLKPELGSATGLQRGDVIEAVDGQPVAELVKQWRPLYAASNEPTRLRDMAAALTRGEPGPVRLRVRRGNTSLELAPTRIPQPGGPATWHDRPGETFQLLTDDVAYLKLSSIKAADIPDYLRRAAATKVLVIDIRNYPSEFVVFSLGGHLVQQATPFVRFTAARATNPGAFIWGPPLSLPPISPRYGAKVVVLVDETSQSQAEYTTMAFRAAGATVVGSTTAGADGNVSAIPLPGGLHTMISGIGVFYPDNRPTQRVGIVPDLEVRPTIEGIRAGRDEVLEAAVSRALGRKWQVPAAPPPTP